MLTRLGGGGTCVPPPLAGAGTDSPNSFIND